MLENQVMKIWRGNGNKGVFIWGVTFGVQPVFRRRKNLVAAVKSDCISSLFKVIHCVSLKVEIVFIRIILIACFKRTVIHDLSVHLRTGVPQG